ncbi:MAG: SusC/RagA family TonB-linked outer membrane protein, partial [Bacteroidales bacterium]
IGYLISGSYLKDEGIISPAQFDRYTIRVNLDHKINDRISISGNTFMSYSNRVRVNESGLGWNGGMVNASLQYPPFLPIYDEATGYFFPNPIRPQVDSPMALANGQRNNSMNTSLNGNFKLTAEIFKNFFYRSEFFARLNYGKGLSFRDRHNTYDGRVYNGIGSGDTNYSLNRTIHNMFEYKNSFGDHNVSFLAGNVYESSNSENLSVSVRDYSSDYIVLLQQANEREAIMDGIGEWKQLSFLSRLNYAYRDKYLLQVNFRADGSPAFGPENRWGYFPSASIGWKISDEAFMNNISQINLLKLRFGLGQTGNDQIGAWGWMATYGSGTRSKYPVYGNDSPITFYSVNRFPNPLLKWEETFEYNLGIDLNAYRGRLDFGLDIYLRDSYDLLFNKPLPHTTGFFNMRTNLGKVRNSGIETYLTTRNISTTDFLWKTSLNFSFNNNEVLDLGDSNEAIFSRWAVVEGYSIGEAYLYQVDRIFQEEDFIYDAERDEYTLKEEFAMQPNAQPGDIKFKNNNDVDLDGDGEIDFMIGNEDRVFLGPSRPPVTWGLTNAFSYKGLSLEVFIQGVHGNYIFNETRVYSEGMEDYFNQFATVLDRWTPENTDTNMPRASYSDPAGNTRDSDRFLEKGDFVRVKDITLSYQFPNRLINSLRARHLSIFLTGQNWFTFTDYSGYDPEVSATDNGVYPQVKTLLFGLNVKF